MTINKNKIRKYPGTIVLPKDSYDIENLQLIGRRVAGKSFFEGIIRNLFDDEELNIIVFSQKEIEQLEYFVQKIGFDSNRINFNIGVENLDLNNVENIHIPCPDIDKWSIVRSGYRSNLFSITGVIHSLCSSAVKTH